MQCIIDASRGNTNLYKVINMISTSSRTVVADGASITKDALVGSGYNKISSSMAGAGVSNEYFKQGNSGGNYMKDKLSGKT